jgi:hypothetical protein
VQQCAATHGECLRYLSFDQLVVLAGKLFTEGDGLAGSRIVEEELTSVGWTGGALARRPKAAPVKLATALRLHQETPMTFKWSAKQLAMGAWTHLNRRLSEQRRVEGDTPS